MSATAALVRRAALIVKVGTLPAGVAEVTLAARRPWRCTAPGRGELARGAVAGWSSRPPCRPSEVIEASALQHAAELVEGVRPVEARVDERRDRLLALLAQRDEARVGSQLAGFGLRLLRPRGQRGRFGLAAGDLVVGHAVEQREHREPPSTPSTA